MDVFALCFHNSIMNMTFKIQQLTKEERYKFYIYFFFTALTIPIFLGSAFHAFGRRGYTESVAHGVLALLIGGSLFGAATARNKRIFYIFHLSILHLVVLYAFFQGGADGSRVLWMYLLPLVTIFLLESGKAIWGFMVVSFLGIVAVFCSGDTIAWIPYNYRPETQIRFFITFALVYLFTFLYTSVRQRVSPPIARDSDDACSHTKQSPPLQESFSRMIRVKTRAVSDEPHPADYVLHSIIENAPVAMYAKDLVGRYLAINEKGLEWLGVSRQEVINQTDFELFSHDVAERSRKEDAEVLETQAAIEIDRSQIVGNELFAAQIYKFPLFDRDGAIAGVCGLTNNISKWKQDEQEIRAVNKRLEMRLQQRTADLEAVDKELTSVAYMISHELNEPIVELQHLASWLMKDYGRFMEKRGRKMLGMLIKRVTHLDHLFKSIAFYAGVERFAGDTQQLDTNALVQGVIDRLAAPSSIQIRIGHSLPFISGDESHIKHVFQQLLQNAVQFMGKAQGDIMVDCLDEGKYWTFFVADNGPGISSQYHASIFDLFQTTAAGGDDKTAGPGIGLAVCRKIVEHYGGQIWVESPPGYGSTFCFTFPK